MSKASTGSTTAGNSAVQKRFRAGRKADLREFGIDIQSDLRRAPDVTGPFPQGQTEDQ